jgi:hypothetical protein
VPTENNQPYLLAILKGCGGFYRFGESQTSGERDDQPTQKTDRVATRHQLGQD